MLNLKLQNKDEYTKYTASFREFSSTRKKNVLAEPIKEKEFSNVPYSDRQQKTIMDLEEKIREKQRKIMQLTKMVEDKGEKSIVEDEKPESFEENEPKQSVGKEFQVTQGSDDLKMVDYLKDIGFRKYNQLIDSNLKEMMKYLKKNKISFDKLEKILEAVIEFQLDNIANLNLFVKLNKGDVAKQLDQIVLSMNEINKTFHEIEYSNQGGEKYEEEEKLYKLYGVFLENFKKINSRLIEGNE